jgi:Short C-terminal domain/zinc-ribbon domain
MPDMQPIDPRRCPNCGKPVSPAWTKCEHCGKPFEIEFAAARVAAGMKIDPQAAPAILAANPLRPLPAPVPTDPIVVWSYPGRTQADAAERFAQHAGEMAKHGYVPTGQSWADGRPGAARVFMVGLFAQSLRPKGYLTVTYQRRDSAAVNDPLDQLKRLGELRELGVISEAEFAAKKADLLGRV